MQLVTVGPQVSEYAAKLFVGECLPRLPGGAWAVGAVDRGIGRVLASADPQGTGVSGWSARRATTTRRTWPGLLRDRYRGCRYSFGYSGLSGPGGPGEIVDLLDAERIGVELSEEFQLVPEQATDAVVVHHPAATYFNAQ